MALAPHLWAALGGRGCQVDVIFHEPVAVALFCDRKALTRYVEAVVRDGLHAARQPSPSRPRMSSSLKASA